MRNRQRACFGVFFSCSTAALAACSGGGGFAVPGSTGTTAAASVAPAGAPPADTAPVTLTLTVPAKTTTARRRPDYVSAGTKSASIAVRSANAGANAAAVASANLNCSSGETCKTSIAAPLGSDIFSVTLYAGTGETGATLGVGTATQQVVTGTLNTVNVTLNGVVNGVALHLLTPASIPAGTATTERIAVDALDAAGFTIVAPGGYVDADGAPASISVTKTDAGNGKGATAFASPSPGPVVTGPGTTLSYAYNGSDIDATTFAATTQAKLSGALGTATVAYVPSFIKDFGDATNSDTNFIAPGPDGQLWFTDFSSGAIGSIVPASGAITHYSIPSTLRNGGAEPEAIVAGPNATMYFAEYNSNAIGAISTTVAATTGAATPVVETDLLTANANPRGIAYGAACGANVWFTEFNGDKIGELSTTTMTVTEYAVPTAAAQPDQIACGPDGNFWFTEFGGNKIGKITTAGAVTEYPLPNPAAAHAPIGIAAGPDGSMWFAESAGNMISSIATSKTKPTTAPGAIVEHPLPAAAPNPFGTSLGPALVTAAPDGDLFFTEFDSETNTTNAMIGRITTTASVVPNSTPGTVTQYPLASTSNMPFGLAVGPDGHVWFTEMGSESIGYLIY